MTEQSKDRDWRAIAAEAQTAAGKSAPPDACELMRAFLVVSSSTRLKSPALDETARLLLEAIAHRVEGGEDAAR